MLKTPSFRVLCRCTRQLAWQKNSQSATTKWLWPARLSNHPKVSPVGQLSSRSFSICSPTAKQSDPHSDSPDGKYTKKMGSQLENELTKMRSKLKDTAKSMNSTKMAQSLQQSREQMREAVAVTNQKMTISIEKSRKQMKQAVSKLIPQHENIYTVPNMLTFTRLVAAPVIGYLIVKDQTAWALGLFVYSCITDFVDGFIARRYNLRTVVGSVIDPMADKLLMVVCTACLAQASQMPMYLAVLILGRDVMLGLSALYFRYISLPPPRTLLRYWDFSIPSAEVHPTTISKYNTFFQMVYIGVAMVSPVLRETLSPDSVALLSQSMEYYGYFVGATTVLSGLSYVFSKNAVKILNKNV